MIDSLSSDQIAQIVYLVLLGTVLGSYALVAMRQQLGQFVRMLLLWGLLFTGVMAGWGLWQSVMLPSITVQQTGEDAIDLRRGRDGAFRLTLEVTGREGMEPQPIHFIVDTGATDIVLTRADAEALGFTESDLAYLGTARTANGVVRTARVTLDGVHIGARQHPNIRALVNEGELHVSLLGMTFLSRFSRIEMTGDRLRLEY
ncbi:retropepsin-like aspartic protease family protein [Pararhodobacter sp.]|jgi:aspartyl protease family protein|uniref:retropepsin-like aspartic protease family protein n=1 Tax=Pararhodobacter sp. TaxID=2127056 RepID=UPI002FDDEE11